MASEDQTASRLTVLLALAMNALIAAAKLVVGAVSGSSAMLAEGAHSVADTVNEVFLLTSLRRSSRPPDSKHPFGYGAERFFWSLLAAIGIFLSGAVFSAYQAFRALTESGSGQHSYSWSYAVLGLAFVAEGVSWVRSVIQLRGEAKAAGHGFFDHLRRTRDPTVKTVFSEDAAALVGIGIAAAAVGLHQATGNQRWDALGAAMISVLLTFVAFYLGRHNMALLTGQSADPTLRQQLWNELMAVPEVDAVVEVLTMHIGADEILLAARLDLADGLTSDDIEDVSSHIAHAISARHPDVTQVFLDATRASEHERERAHRLTASHGGTSSSSM
ncbi:MAG TPA: cation diffusion facilitator family transporter [Nocardioidaceae bacterium]|nr:cation diffusion facilitator family transporter [Nocardioidaceae bacterium]